MKKLLIIGNLLLLSAALRAQSDYFLFIQSDSNQPFYVQTDGKTLSSSSIGHLIISGLKDSMYVLSIGFPKNQYPEQSFQVRINRKDAGYQLKNMAGEGWALFNLQTLQLIKSQQSETKKASISYGDIKRTDVFSTLMAGLVNDSAVLYTSIAKVEPPKENSKTVVSDSQPLPNEIVGQVNSSKVDSPTAIVNTKKDDSSNTVKMIPSQPVLKDTTLVKAESTPIDTVSKAQPNISQAKSNEASAKSSDTTVTTVPVVKKEDLAKKDSVNKEDLSTVPPTPVAVETKPRSNTPALEQSPVPTTPAKPRALIVWLSETKTAAGTEQVYYDMTVPDQIDTIRILIPKEESVPQESPAVEVKPTVLEETPGAADKKGNVFGRLFGKKDKKSSKKNSESSISVTTVDEKKPEPVVMKKKSVVVDHTTPEKQIVNEGEEAASKRGESGNFFGKLFGKKDKASPTTKDSLKAEAPKISTVNVSTVERKKQADTGTNGKALSGVTDDAEVERLKKAQEQEEKTGTERFFGRIFRKKNNSKATPDTSVKDGTSSSIKVTTVEPSATANAREAANVTVTNSDCRQFAGSDDVDKLRVRMLVEKDADAQITEARKTFKGRCFTTEQIKSLSSLFRTDEGKYKFFDAAYPYVSDSRNFKTLVSLLTDQYYINRFKAMVRT